MSPESKPQSRNDDEPDFSEPEPVARHRRDFESWASAPEHNCYLKRIEFGDRAGQYAVASVEFAWRAWLEAAFRANQQIMELGANYSQLIMAVGNKHDGETRHQTALRYITQAEEPKGGPVSVSTP